MGRTVGVLLLSGLVLGATALHGQSTADQNVPAFEVASVKRNTSGDVAIFRRPPGGRVDVTNMPVRSLVLYAYPVGDSRVVGGPSWIDDDRYDIVAKLEGNPA